MGRSNRLLQQQKKSYEPVWERRCSYAGNGIRIKKGKRRRADGMKIEKYKREKFSGYHISLFSPKIFNLSIKFLNSLFIFTTHIEVALWS